MTASIEVQLEKTGKVVNADQGLRDELKTFRTKKRRQTKYEQTFIAFTSLCVRACLGVCLLFPYTLVMVIVDIIYIVSIVCTLESIPQKNNDFSVPLVSNM